MNSGPIVLLVLLLLAPAAGAGEVRAEVADVLDRLHRAAAEADEAEYFDQFAPDAVFMGTAAGERWTIEEFRAFAHPYFAAGRGWTYEVRDGTRNVVVSPRGDIAWFDELLDNASYGECRGTGVARRIGDEWKLAHYSLTIPVPNEIARDVVEMIRALAVGDEDSTACGGAGFEALDFWIGRWDVMADGRKVGTNRIEKILGGCAVMEHWTAEDGGQGKSLFYYMLAEGEWNQVWVTDRATAVGGVKHKRLVERPEGGAVRFQGSISRADGSSYLDRTTLTPSEDGSVRQRIEVSMDDGQTWRTTFDALYVPR